MTLKGRLQKVEEALDANKKFLLWLDHAKAVGGFVSYWERELKGPLVMGDNQNSPSTTVRIPHQRQWTSSGFCSLRGKEIGHRQAGEEAVCFGETREQPRDCSREGGDGSPDRAQVPAGQTVAE
jgi:hypothetical protein